MPTATCRNNIHLPLIGGQLAEKVSLTHAIAAGLPYQNNAPHPERYCLYTRHIDDFKGTRLPHPPKGERYVESFVRKSPSSLLPVEAGNRSQQPACCCDLVHFSNQLIRKRNHTTET